MKEHKSSYLSSPGDSTVSFRKVSFGLRSNIAHTFASTDIVETVHITSEIPYTSNDDVDSNPHAKAHIILSFAMPEAPLPELIPSRPKRVKDESQRFRHFDSEDELSEPAIIPPMNLPDTFVLAPNRLKGMFELPESVQDLPMPDHIEVFYSLDENLEQFSTRATLVADRIYQFIIELSAESDLVKSIEEGLREDNDDEYDSLEDDAYNKLGQRGLKYEGRLRFKVPSLEEMEWDVSVSATRIVSLESLDSEKRSKSAIYQRIFSSSESIHSQRYDI
jgi:hypothetical protein